MAETLTAATNGVQLPVSSLAKTFTYDGGGNVQTITVVYAGITYIQTFTYSGSNVTNISQWVPQ